MRDRAVAPVVGCLLLTAIAVIAATSVGAAVAIDPAPAPPTAAFDLDADETGEIRVTHVGGDAIDPERLRVRVSVGSELLGRQPPIPFFSAAGFESGPTGPFNSATTGKWQAGETASFRIAATNAPSVDSGATVKVRLYVQERKIASLEATA